LRQRAIIAAEWRRLVVMAVLAITLVHAMVYYGLSKTTVINGALFASASPVFVIIIAWAWFKAAARPGEVLGVAVSLCGVLAIVSRGEPDALAALRFGAGDMMIIASVFIWSVYTVLLTHWPSRLDATSFLAVIAVFGWIMLMPFYLIERVFVGDPEFTIALAGAIVYVGVFSSVVAFLGWNFGVKAIGAQRTSEFQHLVPAFAALQAIFFLGERIYPYHVAGIGLILGGLWLANRNRA
jgi:drug/metabolite transporter (DMT)-like permease